MPQQTAQNTSAQNELQTAIDPQAEAYICLQFTSQDTNKLLEIRGSINSRSTHAATCIFSCDCLQVEVIEEQQVEEKQQTATQVPKK